MAEFFSNVGNTLWALIRIIRVNDIIDIIIVAFLTYQAIKLVRETRAYQLLKGILVVLAAYLIALNLNLSAFTKILDAVWSFGLIALAVVFQPELRRALEQVGRVRIGKFSLFGAFNDEEDETRRIMLAIREVCESVAILQRQRMGALMVFECETRLDDIVRTGTIVDAVPSSELLCNIFFNKAPLHDGAVVLRGGKVIAAACILPLSANQELSSELGTRHRAALGVSESSDALAVVVSEETGAVSLAVQGELRRNLSLEGLRAALEKNILREKKTGNGVDKPSIWKGKA